MIKTLIYNPLMAIIYLFSFFAAFGISAFVLKGKWVVLAFIPVTYLLLKKLLKK